jgi:L-gulono-1,4-lactone dehydrogenase
VWRNWSGELSCTPVRVERPVNTLEVATAIERAAAEGRRIRPVGAGHSFTPIALTDEVMLDLSGMDALLHVDRDRRRVRVQAGIRLGVLAEQLVARGLAFENLGDIDVQTLAGAMATATHGTGAELGNLASQVDGVQLVDGHGRIHELTPQDGDRFLAARVGLGALGVITEVTLRVLPAYTLRGEDRVEPLGEVLDSLPRPRRGPPALRAVRLPLQRPRAHPHQRRGAGVPAAALTGSAWMQDRLLTTYGLEVISRAGRRVPAAIPRLNRLVSRLGGSRPRVDARAPRLREPAGRALHRDGARAAPRRRGPVRPRGARADRAGAVPGQLPHRGPHGGRGRGAAVDRSPSRQLLRRGAQLRRAAPRTTTSRRCGSSRSPTSPAPTGASDTRPRPPSSHPATPPGTGSPACAPTSTPAAGSPTTTSTASSARCGTDGPAPASPACRGADRG